MDIERTSKVIKSLFEECYDEDIDIDNLDNWEEKMEFMFTTFSNGKKLNVDYPTMKDFLQRFNKIYKSGVFSNFKEPLIQEYFCKQLNFLLLIDFILTFFRIYDNKFDVKRITTQFIFDFFCRLCEFFYFMNFLDVDDCFVNYLKYMLTLYSFQLDRSIIETKFHYFVEILDNFFTNEIMLNVFSDIKYKKCDLLNKQIKKYSETFSDAIKEYNPNTSYDDTAYNYLDDLFLLNTTWENIPISVSSKTKTVEIPNPNQPPAINNAYTATFNNDNNGNNESNSDSDDSYNNLDEYDDDYDDEYDYTARRPEWTPTIKKHVPIIDKEDTNYAEYRKLFILRNYQKIRLSYDIINSEIKSLCSTLKVKKYDSFAVDNNSIDILKIKTILGCVLDYKKLSDNDYKNIFSLACEYGHIDIIKELVDNKKGDIDDLSFEKAQTSPNRDIPRYLIECKGKYNKIKKLFEKYKDVNYYEPKIRFN